MKRVLIAGAGAMGSMLAAKLAGVANVTVLARGERLRQIAADGIRCDDGPALRVSAVAECSGLAVQDLVVLATKAGDLAAVLEAITAIVGPETVLLTLQNGVDAPGIVAARFPRSTVLGGRVHGFFELCDSVVHHAGVEPSLCFGKVAGEGVGDGLAALLAEAGIAAHQSSQIMVDLWEKFLLAAAIGAVGAAIGVPAGQIRASAEGSAMLAAAMAEIAAIAAKKDICLPADCVAATMAFVAGFPPDVTSSLQRDLEAGRPSEYDALPGAALRMVRECGMAAPVLEQCDRMIRRRLAP